MPREQFEQASQIVSRTFKTVVSIFDVAVAVDQDPTELMELNGQLPDLLAIRPGTPVLVFDAQGKAA